MEADAEVAVGVPGHAHTVEQLTHVVQRLQELPLVVPDVCRHGQIRCFDDFVKNTQ